MVSKNDLEISLHYAKWCFVRAKKLLGSIGYIAAGHDASDSWSRSGDVYRDEADRIVKCIQEIESISPDARESLEKCDVELTLANIKLTPSSTKPGLVVAGQPFNHAHAVLVDVATKLATAMKVWDDHTEVSTPGNYVEINIQRLRENLSEACKHVFEKEFALNPLDLDMLFASAKKEHAIAVGEVRAHYTKPQNEGSDLDGPMSPHDQEKANRNEWFYEQKTAGNTWQVILDLHRVKFAVCEVDSIDGVRRGAEKHAQKIGKPLPKGKGGRPKQKK